MIRFLAEYEDGSTFLLALNGRARYLYSVVS